MKQPRIPISELDPRQALYELQSYQKELEEQNTELQEARKHNETLIEKYTMLYDRAPSGYLTLDQAGNILELNLYALTYLYKDRSEVINTDFKQFISNDTRPAFDEFYQKIFKDINKASCEVTLSIYRDTPIYVHIEGIASDDGKNCLVTMVDVTLLKQTEEALRLSRKEFQDYFENGSVGMSVSSPGKGWIELNQRFCGMLGYSKNELLGINWMDLSLPDDLQANLYLYQQALDGKIDKYQLDKRFIRKDGANLYVTLSVAVERNEDGTVHHLLSSYIDITERELAEKALKESEDKYRLLVENQNDLVVKVDTNGNFLYVSPSYCKLFGKKESELLGKSFIPLVHEDDVEATKNAMKKLYHYPYTCEIEERAWTKDKWCWISWSDKAELNKNKEVVSIIGVGRIINKRKLAEKALKESEMRFRSLFENMFEGFAYCKMIYKNGQPVDFIYIDVNQSFETITGLHDVTGKKVSELIPGILQTDSELFEIYSRVALTGQSERSETYFNGLKIWLHISVYSPAKEYFVAIFDNINERKIAEAALLGSEERFRALFEGSPDANILVDIETGEIIDANKALSDLVLKSVEELKGMHHSKLHPKRIEASAVVGFHNFAKESMLHHKIRPIETPLLRSDGTEVPVEILASIISLNGKQTIQGVFRDITYRKQAEKALILSETKYRNLHESMMDSFVLVDMQGKIMETNESYRQMVGYSVKELEQLTFMDLTPQKWHDYEQKIVTEQILKRGYSDIYEKEYCKKDGSIFPVELHSFLIKNDSNENEGMWAIVRDITRRKKAESEMRFQNELMSQISEAVYLVTMEDGVIVFSNSQFEEMFGYEQGEMTGKQVSIVNAPTEKSPEETAGEIMDCLAEYGYWDGEVKNIKKDGTTFWSHAKVSVFEHSQFGKVLVAVHENITKRKHEEEMLKIKIDELDRFNNLTVGRELKMIELKKEVNQLLVRLGEKEKYKIAE